MLDTIKNLQTVREVFVLNGEYSFNSEDEAERFVKKLLWLIESSYSEDCFLGNMKSYPTSFIVNMLIAWLTSYLQMGIINFLTK